MNRTYSSKIFRFLYTRQRKDEINESSVFLHISYAFILQVRNEQFHKSNSYSILNQHLIIFKINPKWNVCKLMYLIQWHDPPSLSPFTTQDYLLFKNLMWWEKWKIVSESTESNWLNHPIWSQHFSTLKFLTSLKCFIYWKLSLFKDPCTIFFKNIQKNIILDDLNKGKILKRALFYK